MMNVHAVVAKSLREIPGLQGKFEHMNQDYRALTQLYTSEQEKFALEQEKAQRLERDLEAPLGEDIPYEQIVHGRNFRARY